MKSQYLSDEEAEIIGAEIAADFGLKRSRDYPDRWDTESGTFTNRGIARRASRMIADGMAVKKVHDFKPDSTGMVCRICGAPTGFCGS